MEFSTTCDSEAPDYSASPAACLSGKEPMGRSRAKMLGSHLKKRRDSQHNREFQEDAADKKHFRLRMQAKEEGGENFGFDKPALTEFPKKVMMEILTEQGLLKDSF